MSLSAGSSAVSRAAIFSRRDARIVGVLDAEIVTQQLEHRQLGRRLAVRDRVGLQHFASAGSVALNS